MWSDDGSNIDIVVSNPWGCSNPSVADHIQEGRDFFNDTQKPGYTPYTYPHPLATAASPPTGETCDLNADLSSPYLSAMPQDPTYGNSTSSGYKIKRETTGQIWVIAPYADGEVIEVSQ